MRPRVSQMRAPLPAFPRRLLLAAFTVAPLLASACSRPLPAGATGAGDWTNLLPGNADAWRGYKQQSLPGGWRFDADSGILSRVSGGSDIISNASWDGFELELEYRIGPGGNSGIFYRATEETDVIYMNATEMQILDDSLHRDGRNALTSSGSNYALYPPAERAARPVGEWNAVRIVAVGPHVEHWLNGKKVVEYEMWSPEWTEKVKASKFAQWPAYGVAKAGHFGLQDHGDPVSFRNIRARALHR